MAEPKLTDIEMERMSIALVEQYASGMDSVFPNDKGMAVRVLRQNIRALVSALAKIDGNHNTSQFLEVYSIKYSATPGAALLDGTPREPFSRFPDQNVVEIRDFHRKATT